LDAHRERIARRARVQPGQQRRARVAKMDGARRAGGVSSSTSPHRHSMAELKRALGPVMSWGLGVGYVISGMYFGWNLGLPLGGPFGMLAATVIVSIMYVAFVLSYAELSCAMPKAGGVFVYVNADFGPKLGFLAGR